MFSICFPLFSPVCHLVDHGPDDLHQVRSAHCRPAEWEPLGQQGRLHALHRALHRCCIQLRTNWISTLSTPTNAMHGVSLIGFIKVLLYIAFMTIMIKVHTFPLFAIRPMYLAMRWAVLSFARLEMNWNVCLDSYPGCFSTSAWCNASFNCMLVSSGSLRKL